MAPFSGDLAMVTNNDAVSQSLENLILTFLRERPYDYTIGSSIQFRAFENSSDIEAELIKTAVLDCATRNEPRVSIQQVDVVLDSNRNMYSVSIYYYVINTKELQTLNVIIERNR
jgi:phage baseplate assembly protein W